MYLVTVSSLKTFDAGEGERADAVVVASYVDALTDDAATVGKRLGGIAAGLDEALSTAPLDDIQPMTSEQIAKWRDEQREDQELLERIKGNVATARLFGEDE